MKYSSQFQPCLPVYNAITTTTTTTTTTITAAVYSLPRIPAYPKAPISQPRLQRQDDFPVPTEYENLAQMDIVRCFSATETLSSPALTGSSRDG